MSKEDYFFDDCPICRFQREMDEKAQSPTFEQLRKVFKEAEKSGAIVGGPLLDENIDKQKL